jgi:hypothetical protein
MKEMSELKGFNMERILLMNGGGYLCFGYLKDGMIEIDDEFSHPNVWSGWMRISELREKIGISYVNG